MTRAHRSRVSRAAVGVYASLQRLLTPKSGRAKTPRYPGDFEGRFDIKYSPKADSRPDPGEVVWTWVPFEEDPSHGKDRPVLLIGRDGEWLLALMLTSKDHDRDAVADAHWGRQWMDIDTGAWDRQGRPSEVRLDRIVRVDPAAVRRQGAILKQSLYEEVSRSLIACHHW